jgi:hypothetical protein
MRKSDIFWRFILVSLTLLGLVFIHAAVNSKDHLSRLKHLGEMVEQLKITDLCLTTEARHTRNPSQADWHTPFQTHPLALEHFPSGAVVRPPELLRKSYEKMD